MPRRQVIVLALAVVAIGVAVVGVPRGILEWHVRQIAADRGALMAALRAPEASWEWQAVKEFSRRSEGRRVLRLELATLLWEYVAADEGVRLPRAGSEQERIDQMAGILAGLDDDAWCVVGRGNDEIFLTCGGPSRAESTNPVERFLSSLIPNPISREVTTQNRQVVDRLLQLATAAPEAIAQVSGRDVYLLRLSDARIPAEARIDEFRAPDMLVVVVKPSDPAETESSEAPGTE